MFLWGCLIMCLKGSSGSSCRDTGSGWPGRAKSCPIPGTLHVHPSSASALHVVILEKAVIKWC